MAAPDLSASSATWPLSSRIFTSMARSSRYFGLASSIVIFFASSTFLSSIRAAIFRIVSP